VPALGARSAPPTGGEQAIVTNVKPGLVIINTTLSTPAWQPPGPAW